MGLFVSELQLWGLMLISIITLLSLRLVTCLEIQGEALLLDMVPTLLLIVTIGGQAVPLAPAVTLTAGMQTQMSSQVLWWVVLVNQMITMRTEEMTLLPMRLP